MARIEMETKGRKRSPPPRLKPRLFIGSAGESKGIANKIQAILENDVETTIWDQDFFRSGEFTLERLLEAIESFDFAAFIFTPDDVVKIRKRQFRVPRDNVILELGLFLGKLGRKRCFIIAPRGDDKLHLPTDLLGLNEITYLLRQDGNVRAALNPGCDAMRDAIERLGRWNPQAENAANQLVEEFKAYLRANAVEKPTNLTQLAISKVPSEPVPLMSWTPGNQPGFSGLSGEPATQTQPGRPGGKKRAMGRKSVKSGA